MNTDRANPDSAGRFALVALGLVLVLMSLPAAGAAGLLFWQAETWQGRVFAFAFLALFVGLCLFCRWLARRSRRLVMAMSVCGTLAFIGVGICYAVSPVGRTPAGSKLSSVWANGNYCRWSPVNLVPEIDQARLGVIMSPFADAIMTREKANIMNGLFMKAYREMRSDPEFVAVGSVMNTAYRDLFNLPFDQRHLFAYVPAHAPGEKLPVLLFLHGSAGNFKVFIWTLKAFADAHKFAVVAPTFGFGNWHAPGGMEAIESAYNYCRENPDMDAKRIFLAGLSNGALGVSRAALKHPDYFRGIVYISGVLEPGLIKGIKGLPILLIHGGEDERIPVDYVDAVLAKVPPTAPIEKHIYPDADHFLMLSKSSEVFEELHRWTQRILSATAR